MSVGVTFTMFGCQGNSKNIKSYVNDHHGLIHSVESPTILCGHGDKPTFDFVTPVLSSKQVNVMPSSTELRSI